MTKFGFFLVFLMAEVLADEPLNPFFQAVGGQLEMGFCYAVDYILLYKQTVEGKQLLGNSSSSADVSPEAYRGRISPTNILNQLLGMQVSNLTVSDSGVYVTECWKDNVLTNHHEHYLHVCDEEVNSQDIQFESDGGVELVCGARFSGQKSSDATIRWYRETNSGYKTSLFLDTERSLEPLLEEMQGVLQVLNEGSSLHISEDGLKDSRHFTCLVMERGQCKSFQNIQLPDSNGIDVQTVYYSVDERAVLTCLSKHLSPKLVYWNTPFGRVNSTTSPGQREIYISMNKDAGNYSLIIPSIRPDHSGEYQCSTYLVEYFITVCSELVSEEVRVSKGNKVTLDCTSPTDEPTNIQWYRQKKPTLEEQLIYDSGDPSQSMPANLHIEDTSLTITNITEEDYGAYWCVVLLDQSTDYNDESIDDLTAGEGENSDATDNDDDDDYDEDDWLGEEENTDKCILKKVVQLKVQSTYKKTAPPESGTSQYAVIGGGVGALLVILIVIAVVIVVVMKLKAKKKATDQNRAESSELQKEPNVLQPFIPKDSNP